MEGPEQERPVIPVDLREAARREMIREGFAPDFPPATVSELATLDPAPSLGAGVVRSASKSM